VSRQPLEADGPFVDQTKGLEAAVENLTRQMVTEAYQKLKSSYKVAAFLKISQSKAHRLIRRYLDATAR